MYVLSEVMRRKSISLFTLGFRENSSVRHDPGAERYRLVHLALEHLRFAHGSVLNLVLVGALKLHGLRLKPKEY